MRRLTLLSSEIDHNPDFDESELDDRELEVLKFLSTDQNGYFTFQGLRRRLGFHQETLARTLRRLEEAHVIERSTDGYKVRGGGTSLQFTVRTDQTFAKPIIEAYLPAKVDVTVLFQKLRGRWFSNFRWLGYSQDGDKLSMSWISEDGDMQLQAHIGAGKLTITGESLRSNDESSRVEAAYQLFDHFGKAAEQIVHQRNSVPVAN